MRSPDRGRLFIAARAGEPVERYDLVIVLGSQVRKEGGRYVLARHTEMKARAAGIAYRLGIAGRFLISGGYNFWVRYDHESILPEPDESFEAFAKGRVEESEARAIADFVAERYGVPREAIVLEESSSDTRENAEFVGVILRRPAFSRLWRRAVLTLLHHMEEALSAFRAAELKVGALFAEDLLALEDRAWIDAVCEYYSAPRGGRLWNTQRIRELLSEGRSVGELLGLQVPAERPPIPSQSF